MDNGIQLTVLRGQKVNVPKKTALTWGPPKGAQRIVEEVIQAPEAPPSIQALQDGTWEPPKDPSPPTENLENTNPPPSGNGGGWWSLVPFIAAGCFILAFLMLLFNPYEENEAASAIPEKEHIQVKKEVEKTPPPLAVKAVEEETPHGCQFMDTRPLDPSGRALMRCKEGNFMVTVTYHGGGSYSFKKYVRFIPTRTP